ncbi:MAG TPA: NAD(P)/FAD-dependent oxidoreductase [Anaerolineae bacterium]|nr:NAD(P)/FAD-dependent oxidoreductase [Anaerolineae bacterium]
MIEIAVVGAGPAGVSAAVTAAQAGAKVTLIDEYPRAGGQYYKQPPASFGTLRLPASLADTRSVQHGRELLAGLLHPNIDLRYNTLVWNITPDRVLDLYGPQGGSRLQAKKVIIASGAYERVVPFPGWTLPGVTTVGAAQLLLKGQGLLVGQKILVAGTGPLLQLAAVQLLDAGAQIVAIVELQSRLEFFGHASKLFGQWAKIGQGLENQKRLMDAGVPIKFGRAVVRVLGDAQVERAVVARVDSHGRPLAGGEEEFAVDAVCINFGFVPATELTRLAGCEQRFDSRFGSLATVTNPDLETSCRGIFAAGEVRGIGGVEVALLEGRIAGMAAARQLGYDPDAQDPHREWQKARAAVDALGSMFAVKPGLYEAIADDVVVCRCEEVTAGALRVAARAGALQLNGLKAWNRCGMGRCQGRICGPIAAQIVAAGAGVSVESAGAFTARIPIKPVPLGLVASAGVEQSAPTAMEDHVGYGKAIV